MSNLEPLSQDDIQILTYIAEYGRPAWIAYVPRSLRNAIGDKRLNELLEYSAVQRIVPKSGSYAVIETWCADNVGATTSVYDLCELCGMTPPTVRKFMESRIDLFYKMGRGKWLIRDPENERKAEK